MIKVTVTIDGQDVSKDCAEIVRSKPPTWWADWLKKTNAAEREAAAAKTR